MKIKYLVKVILIFLMITTMFLSINRVYANDEVSNVFKDADTFITAGDSSSVATGNAQNLKVASNTIYNILLTIGVVVAVIYASVLGIKFMIGSIEEKAQIKEALVPFIIGCIVVFGSFGIWRIFIIIGNQFTGA